MPHSAYTLSDPLLTLWSSEITFKCLIYSIIRPSITNQKTWKNFKWTGILTNSRSFQENNISFNLYNALGTIYNQPITIMH